MHLHIVRIIKRFLQATGAAPYSQNKTMAKDVASAGSSAAMQDTCWQHFKGVEREASDSDWYLANCTVPPLLFGPRQYWAIYRFHANSMDPTLRPRK